MENSALISIIIATCNAAVSLPRCLNSIQRQAYPWVEVLVQDGNSTDGTLENLQEFAAKGMNIRWQSEPDSGIYDALNKAIPRAEGELIVILGADDVLVPDALFAVSRAARDQFADIYPGRALLIHPAGWQAEYKVDPCDSRAFIFNTPFCHNAMFARQDAYAKIGLYSTEYKLVSDAHWIHRAIKGGLQFAPVDAVLVHFSAGGASSNPDLVMEEAYRLVRENFPALSLDDARYLLHMGKGWESPARLEEVLARYPHEAALAKAARLAAEYAPHSGQRFIDNAAARANTREARTPLSVMKQIWKKVMSC